MSQNCQARVVLKLAPNCHTYLQVSKPVKHTTQAVTHTSRGLPTGMPVTGSSDMSRLVAVQPAVMLGACCTGGLQAWGKLQLFMHIHIYGNEPSTNESTIMDAGKYKGRGSMQEGGGGEVRM